MWQRHDWFGYMSQDKWLESSFSLSDKGKIGREGQGTRMNSVMIWRLGM